MIGEFESQPRALQRLDVLIERPEPCAEGHLVRSIWDFVVLGDRGAPAVDDAPGTT
jgi:hypothetical protein